MTIENFKKIVDMEVSYTWTKMSIISAAEQYAKDFAKSELEKLKSTASVTHKDQHDNWLKAVSMWELEAAIARLEE